MTHTGIGVRDRDQRGELMDLLAGGRRDGSVISRACMVCCVLLGLIGVMGSLGALRAAAQPPQLWQAGATGEEAGQTRTPRGVVAEPAEGRVYVVDQENLRVDVFTPLGEFVRAWGWGVVDGSAELQACTTGTGCQKGLAGPGAGQLGSFPQGI